MSFLQTGSIMCPAHKHALPGGGYTDKDCLKGLTRGVGQVEFKMKHDVTAGALAFTLPLLYHYKAPKKWKRVGRLGNVASVIAIYFGLRWVYGKWWY